MLLKLRTIFLFILSVSIFQTSFSQGLSSEEKKRIKSQLKQYMKNPESYKKEQEAMVAQMASWSKKIKELEKVANNTGEIQTKQNEITSLKIVIEGKERELEELRNKPGQSACQEGQYKVQIGKFDNFSIASYLDKAKCITYETVGASLVYTIVGFNDAKEAFNMAQEARRMGLSGAFVTKFVNKNRVDYDHVAETGEKPYYGEGGQKPVIKKEAKPYNPGPTYVNTFLDKPKPIIKKVVKEDNGGTYNSEGSKQRIPDSRETDISGDDSPSEEEGDESPKNPRDAEDNYKEEDSGNPR